MYTKLFLLSVLEKNCSKWAIEMGGIKNLKPLSNDNTYKTEIVGSFVNFRLADLLTTNTKMSTTISINHLW